jgi:hypothetical protein
VIAKGFAQRHVVGVGVDEQRTGAQIASVHLFGTEDSPHQALEPEISGLQARRSEVGMESDPV